MSVSMLVAPSRFSAPITYNAKVLMVGDSIGAGYTAGDLGAFDRISWPTGVATLNTAYPGKLLQAMYDEFLSGGVDFYHDPTKTCVLVIQGGINDIGAGNGAGLDSLLAQFIGLAKYKGWRVAVPNLLDATTLTSPQHAFRTSHNAYRLANSAAADGVFDITGAPMDDPSSTTYFTDGLHPTVAGQIELEPEYETNVLVVAAMSPRAAATPHAPINSVAPAVTGTAQVGETLSCTTGTWSDFPTSHTYQWKRGASNISGATSANYLLVIGDLAANISCVVTATNGTGSTGQASNTVGPVAAAPSIFHPSDDAALAAHWDFKDVSSVTVVSGEVASIASQGTGLPAAAQPGAARPVYTTDHAEYGAGQFLNSTLSASITKRTFVGVSRLETGWEAYYPYTSSLIGSDSNGGISVSIGDIGAGVLGLSIQAQGVTLLGSDTTPITLSNRFLWVAWYDTVSDAWGFRINGVAGVSGTTAATISSGKTTCIGLAFSGSEYFAGGHYSITAYDEVYSTGDLQIREAAAAWRATGDGSLLPGGHPYKSAPP